MPVPILATKLFIPPPRPEMVARPRLVERLKAGLAAGRKLTLVSASAGFGKTTLVSEWTAALTPEAKVGWLSLEEADSDPPRFLTYLIAALQTAQPGMGETLLTALQSPQPPPTEAILTGLLNETAAMPGRVILVLDDTHEIESRSIDQALAFLVEHLPPNLHLVIVTREDPHLPLARLRARGQMTELRAADLRFTPAEAGDFLNRVMGLDLSAQDIEALETRTEGWIAGLQLAALSMQGRSDAERFIQAFTGSHRFVLDYLAEEVLQRQPEPIHSFLLKTAILDRLCGSLCDAVTGQEDGKERLEILERGNLFIIPLDDQRQWYRYHPLFAEVLQTRLREEQPHQVFSLHQRASAWYEHNGLAADAIHHALAAKDFMRAADLIELAAPAVRRNRQEVTITELRWLKALPDELVRFRPVLSTAYAYALFGAGERETVERRLQDAERWLNTTDPMDLAAVTAGMVVVDKEEFRRLPGMIALLRTAQALAQGDLTETVKNARRVLEVAPENDHLILGGAASTLGLAAWASGDLDAARHLITDGMENVRKAGYISPAIGDAITLADIQIAQGQLHDAMTTYEQALAWTETTGAPIMRGAADMHVGISCLQIEHNDLKTATQHLLKSQALGELAGLPQNPYRWCAAMARIRQIQGDMDGALDLLDQAERLYEANFSPNVHPIAARKARLWIIQGRLDEALGWARSQGLSAQDELSYLHEFNHISLARILLARYQGDRTSRSWQEAVRLLERLLKAAEARGGMGSVIEILGLQALAYHTQDNVPAALLPLQRALALAEPQGYVRMFLDEGLSMMRLLAAVRSLPEAPAGDNLPRKSMLTYTGRLLAAFEAEKRTEESPLALPRVDPEEPPIKDLLVEPLSRRELEILRLIAQGLSNRQIGERLFLALDTVKGHNRNIFDKLQVQSRTEAIARAHELGLL